VRHPGAAWDVFAFLARWTLAVGFLGLAVGLLVHVAPATHQPLPWVSLGTTIVTVWWVIVSVGFYFYLTGLASYDSVFGSLASVIVVIAYLYIHDRVPVRSPTRRDHPRPIHRNTVRRRTRPFAPALASEARASFRVAYATGGPACTVIVRLSLRTAAPRFGGLAYLPRGPARRRVYGRSVIDEIAAA
jgi:hypothetical protein